MWEVGCGLCVLVCVCGLCVCSSCTASSQLIELFHHSSSNGTRHLQGCYVNIDDFHNRHHTLRETCGDTREVIYRIGNHNMA